MPPKSNVPKKNSCKEANFCFHAIRVFLTYPKCDLEKEVLLEQAQTKHKALSYTIGREKHQDGTWHLHAVIVFEEKLHSHDNRIFDLEGHHPNIKKIATNRALKNFQTYARKDGNFITNEHMVLGKREQLFTDVLKEGLTPMFVRNHPEIMSLNYHSIRCWINFANPREVVLKDLPKQRHIWLYGPRNTGKTTWLRMYQRLFESVGIAAYNDDWGLIPYNCDLIIADEYKGQLTVQRLNAICDGGTHLNTKGGSIIIGQPKVVICSNFSPSDCYPNCGMDIIQTILARFILYPLPGIYPKLPTCEL